jgi:hypothetical protein
MHPTLLLENVMALVDSLIPGLGNWVDGNRFFNREKELELFIGHLTRGESISLVAQRRIGKTSLMREAARALGEQAISIHVDLEKSHSPEDAIVELSLALKPHGSLWKSAVEIVGGAARGVLDRFESVEAYDIAITLRSSLTKQDWRQKGDAIFVGLAQIADRERKSVILFVDEVPILVSRLLKGADGVITPERRSETDIFMSWLRDNAMRHRGKVAIVVTGSIGLEPLLGQAGLNGTLNAYRSFELRPWSEITAVKCLLALAKGQELPLADDGARHMIAKIGCPIPHHVQMFFDHVHHRYVIEEHVGDVTIGLIDEVYAGSMTGLRGHPELSHMEERLRLVLAIEHFQIALELLTEAATSEGFVPETAAKICASVGAGGDARRIMNDILAILVHDGYLEVSGGRYVFASKLLQDWWARRFGQGYKSQAVG